MTVGDVRPGDFFYHPRLNRKNDLLFCVWTLPTKVDTAVGPFRIAIDGRKVGFIFQGLLEEESWKTEMEVVTV